MAAFDSLLTTDEDVAIRAAGDFATLVPAHQRAAYGTDGELSGWTLTTGANLSGLAAGHVVAFERKTPAWHDLLAVESADTGAGTVTLKRIGLDAGDGPPPAPLGGTTGLLFYAPTARPQIAAATRTILRRWGFADYAAIASALDGAGDAEDFRELATLDVLISLLGTQHRAGSSEENFHTKYKDLIAERATLSAELVDQYEVPTTGARPLIASVMRLPTYRTPATGSEF